MNMLLFIPTTLIVLLAILQGVVLIHYAKGNLEKGRKARAIDAVFSAVIILIVLTLEPLMAELCGVALFFLLRSATYFYVEGRLRGKGVAVVKKGIPVVLGGLLVLFLILWGLDRFL